MKILKIICFIILGMVLLFITIAVSFAAFMPEHKEQKKWENFDNTIKKALKTVEQNKTDSTIVTTINHIENYITTIDTTGLLDRQKTDIYNLQQKLSEKQKWIDQLTVSRRLKGLFLLDGSNPELVNAVKNSMNDPDSFTHVETTYYTNADMTWVALNMTFRGKNAFGGTVTNLARCQLHDDGSIKNFTIQ